MLCTFDDLQNRMIRPIPISIGVTSVDFHRWDTQFLWLYSLFLVSVGAFALILIKLTLGLILRLIEDASWWQTSSDTFHMSHSRAFRSKKKKTKQKKPTHFYRRSHRCHFSKCSTAKKFKKKQKKLTKQKNDVQTREACASAKAIIDWITQYIIEPLHLAGSQTLY